ncbi:MAG: HIT family protein [Bacteroidaceae bacterium]|nr:HIT family protein [Bacteroidaceae bacterium]
MPTIFTRIIQGEIPSYKVAEDDEFYAFFDINPLKKGHTLVVPKREQDYIFDIADDEIGRMMVFAKHVAQALKAAVPCRKVGVAVIGLEVNHAHIHLVPLDKEGDLDFAHKTQLPPEEMEATARAIAQAYAAL